MIHEALTAGSNFGLYTTRSCFTFLVSYGKRYLSLFSPSLVSASADICVIGKKMIGARIIVDPCNMPFSSDST